jgi:hypothetical protein
VRPLRRALILVGTVLILVGAVAGVLNREVLDGDRFADHLDAVRSDPSVARQLGGLVTDRIIEAEPDLTAVRPLLESTATGVMGSATLAPAVRVGASPLHSALVGGGDDPVVLRLADVAAIVIGVGSAVAPQWPWSVPPDLDVRLSDLGAGVEVQRAVDLAHLVRWLSWLCPLLGLVLLGGAGAMAPSRSGEGRVRGAVATAGTGVVWSGLVLAGVLVLVDVVVRRADRDTLGGAVQRAAWEQLDGAFWVTVAMLILAGYLAVLATRAELSFSATRPREAVAAAWAGLTDVGTGRGERLLRALVLVLVGVALLADPTGVLTAIVVVVGAGVLSLGVLGLLWVAGEGVASLARLRRPAVGVVAAAAFGAVVVAGALPPGEAVPGYPTRGDAASCNGHAELCDRSYDDVAYPATHNAMAAASEPGWFFAEQPDGVIAQLDHGIRVLLIDSWYGQHTQRPGVIANTDESRASARAEAEEPCGAAAVRSALRVRGALNAEPSGPVDAYLCHGLCELGSTQWLPLMREVRTWLDAHPREVVTFFIQDTVSPGDTAELFDRAGLLPYVYEPLPGQPWPTLRQMIDSGNRLVVLMEDHGGGAAYPWLIDGFDVVQDTPFLFRRGALFSCAENRGPQDAPLFLLNHWITDKAREVSSAARVNARGVLEPRVEECRAERGLLPNFVAVDFYDQGDLFDVVDDLNGVG